MTVGSFHPFVWYQCSLVAVGVGGLKSSPSAVADVLTFRSGKRLIEANYEAECENYGVLFQHR